MSLKHSSFARELGRTDNKTVLLFSSQISPSWDITRVIYERCLKDAIDTVSDDVLVKLENNGDR